jgi:pimeloyl-ACP methyl ester carboxylesterase
MGNTKWGLIAVACGLGLTGCAPVQPSVESLFVNRPAPVMRTYTTDEGRALAAAETGNANGPLVVMLHGTPGGWAAFLQVMADPQLAARALLVSVDRPGWGQTGGPLETSLAAQARAIEAVLAAHPQNRPAIVVGHSLGGPVAARLAMDFPAKVDGLVLVAGAIDPDLEKTTWYQAVARWRVVRWAVPAPLARAELELRPLKGELEAMRGRWADLRLPVEVVQGEADTFVPAANAAFAQRMMTGAKVTVNRHPNEGHMIPWTHPEWIVGAITRVLDQAAASKPAAVPVSFPDAP